MFDPSDCQQLQVSLHFFDETIVAVKYDRETGCQTAHPVALTDVALALAGVSSGGGLLPDNALFWQRSGGRERMGLYVPARHWPVRVRVAAHVAQVAAWRIPMPPLLWVGCGVQYSVWALKQRPRPGNARVALWKAPLPNVHADGRVCAGTVRFPECSPAAIQAALALFFASEFNWHIATGRSQSHPDALLELWRRLDGQPRYPLRDLVPAERLTVADVIAAGDRL